MSMPSLLDDLAWTAEMPDCFGANATLTSVQKTGERAYHVTIDGHDNGGSGCHAWYTNKFEGTVIVDELGAIVRADFNGTEAVVADPTPTCRDLVGTKRLSAHLRRSCKQK